MQSKATIKDWENESSEGFDFRCDERDLAYWLQGNAPVILVVSRPRNREAYWVSIKDYFHDLETRKHRKVRFSKSKNVFDAKAAVALTQLAMPREAGVYLAPPPKREALFSNLLPVRRYGPDLVETPDDSEDASSVRVDFHDLLKARGLTLGKPIQMVRPVTYDDQVKEISRTGRVRGLQDAATRAWNFHTALYYKAGGTPWRLLRNPSDLASCYVGVSFYRSLDKERVHTSVAQVFNERGEGMILRGGDAQMSKEDRQPHLSQRDMASLLVKAIKDFHREHRHMPARLVVHKTSSFNDDEMAGCKDALQELNVSNHDLLVVGESFTRLFRDGTYPPLRGTFINFDSRFSILYTRGSIDFYMMYPGMYVPKSLEFQCVDTEQPPRTLAQEILALTKMNWNNTQFDSAFPITIKAARQVGAILKYVESATPIQAGYGFYM